MDYISREICEEIWADEWSSMTEDEHKEYIERVWRARQEADQGGDNWTHYPLLVTGPGMAVCGCPAGQSGRGCYHRQTALSTLEFIPIEQDELDEFTLYRLDRIQAEWEKDGVRDMLSNDCGPDAA